MFISENFKLKPRDKSMTPALQISTHIINHVPIFSIVFRVSSTAEHGSRKNIAYWNRRQDFGLTEE